MHMCREREPEEEMICFSVRDPFPFSVRRRQVSFKKQKNKKTNTFFDVLIYGCIPYSKFVRNRRVSLFFFCVSKSVIGFFPPRSAAVGGVQRDSRSGSVLIWREPAVSSSVESGLRERGLVRKRLRI